MSAASFGRTRGCRGKRWGIRHLKGPLLVFLLVLLLHPLSAWADGATVDVIHSQAQYPAGDSYPILFRIRIPAPWYIHGANDAGNGIIPTQLSFSDSPYLKIVEIQFPATEKKHFTYSKAPLEVFSGEIFVRARLAIDETAPIRNLALSGQLFYQACSPNACLPPEKIPIRIPVSIVEKGATAKRKNQDLFDSASKISNAPAVMSRWALDGARWWTLVGVFFGGLALNLTPCIYPLIPITVSYFGGRRKKNRGRTLFHGILYISGLSVTNSILGVTASMSGGMMGSALQEPAVLLGVAGILLLLALSFFGYWELRLPSGLTRLASKNLSGYLGTFFMGLTLGVLAAPCVGPFLLGLLTFVGQKGDPYLGFLYFFVLSLGLGLPLTVLALFSGSLEKLPLSGEWMVWIRKALGWVLVGMAGYFLKPLMPTSMVAAAVLGVIWVAAGLHLGWLESASRSNPNFIYFRRLFGVLLIGGAIVFLLVSARSASGVDWIPYSPTVIQEAAQRRNPVILDFYADWCGPCVTMDKHVFRDPEIVKMSQYLTPVRVNLTQRHALQNELLERYRIRGVPTVIFINRHGSEEKEMRIESYVNRDEVLRKMKRLIRQS